MIHRQMNMMYGRKRRRSAKAPVMRAGVITANMPSAAGDPIHQALSTGQSERRAEVAAGGLRTVSGESETGDVGNNRTVIGVADGQMAEGSPSHVVEASKGCWAANEATARLTEAEGEGDGKPHDGDDTHACKILHDHRHHLRSPRASEHMP